MSVPSYQPQIPHGRDEADELPPVAPRVIPLPPLGKSDDALQRLVAEMG